MKTVAAKASIMALLSCSVWSNETELVDEILLICTPCFLPVGAISWQKEVLNLSDFGNQVTNTSNDSWREKKGMKNDRSGSV